MIQIPSLKQINIKGSCYLCRCSTEHVETMIIPLRIWQLANTWSFQQISSDSSTRNSSFLIKLNLHKLTKTTAKVTGEKIKQIRYAIKICAISRTLVNFHLELLFLTVFALPKASRTGFDCKTRKRGKKVLLKFVNVVRNLDAE